MSFSIFLSGLLKILMDQVYASMRVVIIVYIIISIMSVNAQHSPIKKERKKESREIVIVLISNLQ